MTDARNFLVNSDYPTDHIVFLKSGSYTIPASSQGQVITVPHGLGFMPLFNGQWSQTSDFSVAYDFDTGTFPSANPQAIFNISVGTYGYMIGADNSNVYLSTSNFSTSNQLIYYRIYAFQPDDISADTVGTASSADNFVFNSDDNYMKLYLAGHIPISGSGTYSVPHNLNYIPRVRSWYTTTVTRSPANGGYTTDYFISVDESNVSLVIADFSTASNIMKRFDYRVYIDKAVI